MPRSTCPQGLAAISIERSLFPALEMLFDTPLLEQLADVYGRHEEFTILEVGAGTGRLALKMARQHPQAKIIAVEIDPIQIETARYWASLAGLSSERVEFVKEDLEAGLTWIADRSIDAYVSNHTLNMVARPHLAQVLIEAVRVMYPPGRSPARRVWASAHRYGASQ